MRGYVEVTFNVTLIHKSSQKRKRQRLSSITSAFLQAKDDEKRKERRKKSTLIEMEISCSREIPKNAYFSRKKSKTSSLRNFPEMRKLVRNDEQFISLHS